MYSKTNRPIVIGITAAIIGIVATFVVLSYSGIMGSDASQRNAENLKNEQRMQLLEQKIEQLAAAPTSTEQSTVAPSETNNDLARQVATLQQQLAELKNQRAEEAKANEGERVSTLPSSNLIETVTPIELAAQEEEKALLRDARVEASFLTEGYDDIWSSEIQTKVAQRFEAPEFSNSRLVNIDCKTITCLLEFELSPDTNGAFDPMFENNLVGALSEDLPTGTIKSAPDGSGGLRYTVYMAKNGHSLPGMQDPN